jgi:hypothetical protein
MSRFLMTKHFNSLKPTDAAGEAAMRKLGIGELVQVEIKQPRNLQHHRLFWALMSLVHDNIDHERYPTVEDLVAAVKISAGLRTRIELPNGEIGFIPGSIAFHKMDQAEFDAFYERVCDLIAKYFLPGVEKDALAYEVKQMIGVAA